MNTARVDKVVIAGGGTAGWMAAASLSRLVGRPLDITLVESEEIGIVGVGEATIPTLLTINRLLKIPEPEFIHATGGTFKLGIQFENWLREGHRYFHSFGDTGHGCWACGFHHFWLRAQREGMAADYGEYCPELKAAELGRFGIQSERRLNYAYHLDASRYGQYLRAMAEQGGVRRVEGKIAEVQCNPESGHITGLRLEDGQQVPGDLFIDCTGFRALLIEGTLKTGFEDWSHWLPCNRALAVQSELAGEPVPYTRSIAHDAGWQWRIPLQHRAGNGLVYCSDFLDDDTARQRLLGNIPEKTLTDPRPLRFTAGRRRRNWHKNCIALGLASGFVEPLESTSIHAIQNGIMWLLLMFPDPVIEPVLVDEYNAKMEAESRRIRDFIVLHYTANRREGDPFWDYCRNMELPDSLAHRIELFRATGRIFKPLEDVFAENSWVQVMMGQGIVPVSYHNIVDAMSREQLAEHIGKMQREVQQTVDSLPPHGEFVRAYSQHGQRARSN